MKCVRRLRWRASVRIIVASRPQLSPRNHRFNQKHVGDAHVDNDVDWRPRLEYQPTGPPTEVLHKIREDNAAIFPPGERYFEAATRVSNLESRVRRWESRSHDRADLDCWDILRCRIHRHKD